MGMENEFTVKKINDWRKAAEWLDKQTPYKKCFFLYGEMGVGKTTFVKSFCTYLKIDTPTSSPTFSLVNVYESDNQKVYHLDLYRLKSFVEALDIGIEDYLYNVGNYCFVEWPQIIENIASPETVRIKISLLPDSSRKIVIL